MDRLLYVDIPFADERGGDKNRSRFLWKALNERFNCDLLLVLPSKGASFHEHGVEGELFTIYRQEAGGPGPRAIYNFDSSQLKRFKAVVSEGGYDMVFFRFASHARLAGVLKNIPIAFDIDMLFSRLAALAWDRERTVRNRYYFLEKRRLAAFEKSFFNKSYLFFFSNPGERALIWQNVVKAGSRGVFRLLPNVMEPPPPPVEAEDKSPYLLFFGTLNSAANEDSYSFLMQDIYPHIEGLLQERGLKLYIAGKNRTALYEQLKSEGKAEQVEIIGEVDDIDALIGGARFVILPLRVASGTRTRILEAARMRRAVVTTRLGAEGLEFGENELVLEESGERLAAAIEGLIKSPERAVELGEKLYARAEALYSAAQVGDRLCGELENYRPNPLRLAIVTNRFYPEVGGAETNIYFQARELSAGYDVTIICPKRIDRPSMEIVDNFKVVRLFDLLNPLNRFPNIKSKTLCPTLFARLLAGGYDIIQTFPSLNYNNIVAFAASRVGRRPMISCFFDFLDYATIIKEEGGIEPGLLESYRPRFRERYILKRLNHIFAISNKEMELYRKFNSNVGYSPVPILLNEYEQSLKSPRGNYGVRDDEFVFLCLGRVSNIKGQDIALEAFARSFGGKSKVKLVIVGRLDYEPDFTRAMEQFVRENGLEEQVIFTGMVEREEVLGWLKYADIHVIPVRFMNSGAVVVESWASGTPVLQSDVVDPNLVVEGKNGYLFKSESVDHLAEKMLTAYDNRNHFNELADAGQRLVRERYSYKYLIKLYSEVYERLMPN